jgi:hypothetical protein
MFYCKYCKKEVLIYSVSYSANLDKDLEDFREKIESEGKLLIFNPPPIGPYKCPICGEILGDL